MSYTKMTKQWEKESKMKDKQEKEERKRQQERAEHFKNEIYIAKGIQEKQEQKEYEERQEIIINAKRNIINALQTSNPFTYPQYLIIWDVLNSDYYSIQDALFRGKINKSDITGALQYIKVFSEDIISSYWREVLASA